MPDISTPSTFMQLPVELLRLPEVYKNDVPCNDPSSTPQLLPLLVCKNDDHYVIIDGCKRFMYMGMQRTATCWCGLMETPGSAADLTLLRIRLNSNRSFTPSERYLHLRSLAGSEIGSCYQIACQQLGIDKNDISAYERLVNCSPEVIAAFKSGTLDLHAAADIDRLDPRERTAMLSFISTLSFSRQMQKEIIEWIPELAFRERVSIVDLLNAEWIVTILKNDRMNAPQKIDKLRLSIYEHRFPTIARAKKAWIETVAKINSLPQNIQFKPSEAFEKNRLELKITVSSAEEAHHIFTMLEEIPVTTWDQLIYPAQLYSKNGSL